MALAKRLGAGSVSVVCGIAALVAFCATCSAQDTLASSGANAGLSFASTKDASENAAESTRRSRVSALPADQRQVNLYEGPVRPFSAVAFEIEAGTLGVGAEVSTPLTRSFNLRGGAEFLSFNDGFAVDAAQYQSEAHLRSGHVGVDVHPLGGAFRISPQLLIFGSSFSASVSVAGGEAFELGNSSYLSSTTDPVHGAASIAIGQHVMPALTVGWGNMLGRRSRRWSIPFEMGVAYTGHYTLNLNLSGTACLNYIYCMSTNSAQVQQSLQQEESDLNETMKHFQVYPLVNTGFAYRF